MLAGQLFCDFELANRAIDGSPAALVSNSGFTAKRKPAFNHLMKTEHRLRSADNWSSLVLELHSKRQITLKNLFFGASTVTMTAFLGLIFWSAYDLFMRHRAIRYSEHEFMENTFKNHDGECQLFS